MSKYMCIGLMAAGRLVEKRMLENGIPEKFLSANLYRKTDDGLLEWKNGDTITEETLDKIYEKIWNDQNIYGDRNREAELFRQISLYRGC